MRALIVILAGLYGSYYFVDIKSESISASVVAPILFFIFLVSFTMWLVFAFHKRGIGEADGSGGYDGSGVDLSDD